MPNWCSNRLYISGDADNIRKIYDAFTTSDTAFQTLIGKDSSYTDEQWYEHNVSRYGTKWDVGPIEDKCVYDGDDIQIEFETAWSPPSSFVLTLCKQYKVDAVLEYWECGMGFSGKEEYTYDSGEVYLTEDQWEFHEGLYFMHPDEWMNMELEYLIENAIENSVSLADLQGQYSFLSDDDMNTLTEKYTNF